jgi:alpha-methylacyl-CoA racemase
MRTLSNYRVLELAGIGPGPMAGMMLADMGAMVIRIERPGSNVDAKNDISLRGKKSVVLDLKHRDGAATLLRMISKVDVLIDPFRPGVCEKLSIGPETCFQHNPRLVYGRITGWGQQGPLAQSAGHDINYISLTGTLHAIGEDGRNPTIPLNLVGDMGGGGMLLVTGILAALLESTKSGQGQVIDAAMVDGTATQMWMAHSMHSQGKWDDQNPGTNMLDGGAHFYNTYQCADGKYISIGAIEPRFHGLLIETLGLDIAEFADYENSQTWASHTETLANVFRGKTRQQWCDMLEGTDACFAPVLTMTEAPEHPANVERNTYTRIDDLVQPSPAPRFSRTPSSISHSPHEAGADSRDVLASLEFEEAEIENLFASGVVA